MTWVTVQSHDIGDTFPGIYALEKVLVPEARMRLVLAYREKRESFGLLCGRFGISRKSAYKWLKRYCAGGYRR